MELIARGYAGRFWFRYRVNAGFSEIEVSGGGPAKLETDQRRKTPSVGGRCSKLRWTGSEIFHRDSLVFGVQGVRRRARLSCPRTLRTWCGRSIHSFAFVHWPPARRLACGPAVADARERECVFIFLSGAAAAFIQFTYHCWGGDPRDPTNSPDAVKQQKTGAESAGVLAALLLHRWCRPIARAPLVVPPASSKVH